MVAIVDDVSRCDERSDYGDDAVGLLRVRYWFVGNASYPSSSLLRVSMLSSVDNALSETARLSARN